MFALGIYMAHASLEHVFAKNAILLQMMCELLNEEKLRMAASDCLLALVERRRVWFYIALHAIYCCSYNNELFLFDMEVV